MAARKATELTDLIKKLRTIRRQHEQALAEIENTFRQFGIEHLLEGSGRKRGGAAAATAKPARGKPGPKPKKGKVGRPPKKVKGKPGPKPKGKVGRPPKSATKGKVGRPPKKGKVGRPPKAGAKGKAAAKKGERRVRGSYAETGDEFIVSFLAKKGSATTNEIRQHWTKSGRRGKAENNLTGLVKRGQVTRIPNPSGAGSSYGLPAGSSSNSSSST